MTQVLDESIDISEPIQDTGVIDEEQKPVFNKIQMSEVVRREREKAYEKGKREAMLELQPKQENITSTDVQPPLSSPHPQNSLGGMPQLSQEQIREMIAQEAPKAFQAHLHKATQENAVNSFANKMTAAEEKYPELAQKLNDLDYDTFAPIALMANDMENTADIMNELTGNPMKIGNLLALLQHQPKLAFKAMHDLSNSIKKNQDAHSQEQSIRSPIGQLKSSKPAGIDDSSMSVADFRKIFR